MLWGLLSPVVDVMGDAYNETLNASGGDALNASSYPVVQRTHDRLNVLWDWFPLIPFFGLLLWGFARLIWNQQRGM